MINIPFATNFLMNMKWRKSHQVPEIEPKSDISEGGMLTEEAEAEATKEEEAEATTEAEVPVEEDTKEESDTPELSKEESAEEDKFQEALESSDDEEEEVEESDDEEEEVKESEEEEEESSVEEVSSMESRQRQISALPELELQQFKCESCSVKIYLNKEDNPNDEKQLICPSCERNTKRIRKFDMIIKKVEDLE